MATRYFPNFTQQNYEAVRRRFPNLHLPTTWNEWTNRVLKEDANTSRGGHSFVEIEIDPDEFARYCNRTNAPGDFENLEAFTLKKSSGEKY